MVQLLSEVTLTDGTDEVRRALEKSGKYSTRCLYKQLTTGGVIDTRMLLIWKSNIPLTVKIFFFFFAGKSKSSYGWQHMIEYNLGSN